MWCGAEMGKRAGGLLIRVPEGTTHVGTATVRDVLRAVQVPAKKPSKFHNVGAVRGEIKFDSKREAKRYDELVTLEALGIISNLKLQVPFVIAPAAVVAGKKAKARTYVADFVYDDCRRTGGRGRKGHVDAGVPAQAPPDEIGFRHRYFGDEVMARWTKEELLILKEMFDSPLSLAAQEHRLPHKSLGNIQQTGRARGFKKVMPPKARDLILALMADGAKRTCGEIVRATGIRGSFCKDLMAALVRAGEMHICEWRGAPPAHVYVRGRGVSAPRPLAASKRATLQRKIKQARIEGMEIDDIDDRLLDEAFRDRALWWPWGDPVVLSSMNALVRAGRSAA